MTQNYFLSRPGRVLAMLAMLLTLGQTGAWAQVTSYSFSQVMGTYSELPPTDNTSLDSAITTGSQDEANYARRLGFTFRFNGRSYTSVTVSTNGFVALGTTNTGTYGWNGMVDFINNRTYAFDYNNASIRRVAGLEAIIGGLISDMQRSATDNVGHLYMATVGTAPNRRFVAQYKNWRRYSPRVEAATDDYNFQIILHETSNLIEVVFGQFAMSATDNRPQIGLRGQDPTLRDIMTIGGSWGALTRGTNPTEQVAVDPGNLPPSGLTLRFAPIPPAPNDLGVVDIISPRADQTTCLLSAQEPVRVVVRNFGTNTQTVGSVAYRVNSGQIHRRSFTFSPPIPSDGLDTVAFTDTSAANLSQAANYRIRAYTELGTEPAPNHANDTTVMAINLTGPVNPPAVPIGTLADAMTRQWAEAQGTTVPGGNSSNWTTGFPFVSESMALVFDQTGTNANNNEWLLSPNYTLSPAFFLVFKSYVTKDAFGGAQIVSIGDDTVKVMVSTDCGNTWRVLKKFSQADVTAGLIDNNPDREFRIGPLVNVPGGARIAFVGTSNNTPALEVWRFHVDDVEFKEVLPTDLGVTRILAPVSSQPGCLLGAQENVTVVVKNFGSATQTSSPVAYRVRTRTGVSAEKEQTFAFSPALAPGGEDTVTFSGPNGIDLSTPGSMLIQAYSKLPGESSFSHLNDTAKSDSVRISAPLQPTSPVVGTFGMSTANGWGRGRGLDRPSGTLSSWGFAGAAPAEYIGLTFVTTANTSQREWWFSPSYAGTDFTSITFKAAVMASGSTSPALNGMEDDTVYLKISHDCGASWTTIRKFSNADVTAGRLSNIPAEFNLLTPSPGQAISFGFFGNNMSTSTIVAYRFVIDDVKIRNAVQNDQGVIRALAPFTNLAQCTQTCVPPRGIIRNYGAAAQTSATITYTVNGGAPKTETFTLAPALVPGATDTLTFGAANCADLSTAGTYQFRFFTTTTGEDTETHLNDTLKSYSVTTRAAVAVPGTGSQLENFDNAVGLPAGWLAETNQATDWKIVLGRGSAFTDGISTRMYFVNSYSWFVTQRYQLPSTAGTSLQFDFRVMDGVRGTEGQDLVYNDSILVEVSNDCGANWTRLKRIDSTNHVTSGNFISHTIPLDAYVGQEVVFRTQVWMRRSTATGALVDIDNWRLGAPVSAKDKAVALGFGLAPNPARDRVVVTGPESVKAAVTVLSSLGQQVAAATLAGGRAELDLSRLAAGIYQVRIAPAKGGKPQVMTLVKE